MESADNCGGEGRLRKQRGNHRQLLEETAGALMRGGTITESRAAA